MKKLLCVFCLLFIICSQCYAGIVRTIEPSTNSYTTGHLRVEKLNIQVTDKNRYIFYYDAVSLDNRYDYPNSSYAPWVQITFLDRNGKTIGSVQNVDVAIVSGGGGRNGHKVDITSKYEPDVLESANSFTITFSRCSPHHV